MEGIYPLFIKGGSHVRAQGSRLIAVLTVGMLVLVCLASPVLGSSPPPQGGTPHPTLPPAPGPLPGGPEGAVPSGAQCAGLRGTVINWGFQNEPGITLRLGNGDWQMAQITSTDGSYQFGPLGEGVAFLKFDLPPTVAETLRPMADDVAIRLRCDFDIVANPGLYSSSDRPDPPATLTMGVSQATLLPGGTATFYLTLKNGMPHPISHVFVTDYLPAGLTVTGVTATLGTVEVLNERMVTLDIGELPQGGQETIQIAVKADRALANGTRLKNTASLLYAESAADQAWVTLTVGSGGAVAAKETPTVPPPTPVAEQTPGPSNELLPVTGVGTTAAVPVVGIGLAIVLLGARRLRNRF